MSDFPNPPDHIDEDARAEWDRVQESGAELTDRDVAILAAYCTSYSRWQRLQRLMNQMGEAPELVNDPVTKERIVNPYLAIATQAMDRAVKCAELLGLSPASRKKIEEDSLDSIFG